MSLIDRLAQRETATAVRPGRGRVARGDVHLVPEEGAAAHLAGLRAPRRIRREDELRARVQSRITGLIDAEHASEQEVKETVVTLLNEVAADLRVSLTTLERHALVDGILADVLGLGPLEPLLADPDVTDVLVNGPDRVYVERNARMEKTGIHFDDQDHLLRVVDRIVSRVGRRVDESSPMADARLADGARVNVILPPLALNGPILTIRRFAQTPLEVDDLVRLGTVTPELIEFLRHAVRGKLNIVVSGGGSSGKTTMLNVLSSFIPEDERIVTVEDAAELQLRQVHVVPLEARPANIEGRGKVSIRDLVINALRMRPDRIVVGECRGPEALDMLQAMNTGHEGSLTTMHANSPNEAVARIEVMILMGGQDLPSKAIREQVGSALHLFVHLARLRDGSRHVTRVSEVLGFDGRDVHLRDIFTFKQEGLDEDGRVRGRLVPTGALPQCLELLTASGENVDPKIFSAR